MDIKAVVDEVLALPNMVNAKLDSWNIENVFKLSLDVAVVVMKKTTSASKDANAVLVASVVSEVLETLSSAVPEKSTEVSEHWDSLKRFASEVLPVVLSHMPNLKVSRSLLDCFSFCKRVSSALEPGVNNVKEPEVKESEVKESDVKEPEVKESEVKESEVKESEVEAQKEVNQSTKKV